MKANRRSGSSSLWPLALLLALAGCASGGGTASQPISTAGYGTAFAHGALAFQEGRDDEAATLFEEAIRQDPREGTARHWLGLTYLRLGRRDEAIAQLEASLRAERPPEAGRRQVLSDLRHARSETLPGVPVAPGGRAELPPLTGGAAPRWEGRLGIEALRDSNAALLPGDLPFPIFGLGEPVSDGAARVDLQLDHQPFQGRRGWSLGLGVAGSHSAHRDLGDLDLSVVGGTVSLAWGNDPLGFLAGPRGSLRVPVGQSRFTVLLQASGAHAWLGGGSYLRLAEGAVSLGIREAAWTLTRIDVQVLDRSFEPALVERFHGGRESSIGLSQSFRLGGQNRYVRLGVRAGEVSGSPGSDGEVREAEAEVGVPLYARWALVLSGSWTERSFDHEVSNFARPSGPARDDALWQVTAASAYRLTSRVQWTARASWAERDSNVELLPGAPLLDYRRTIVATGLEWSFR